MLKGWYKTSLCMGVIVTLLLSTSCVYAEGEAFEPMTKAQLEEFYSTPERSVTVSVNESKKLHTIPNGFLGLNLSYFNTTDEIWEEYDLLSKLKKAKVGALRYPGGEETSFFHWEHPGVNGFEDLWDPKEKHGTALKRGRFQMTWVDPEKWATNESFMDFDEFMQTCQSLCAEPIVGVNLTSGRRHNRIQDGIKEALRLLKYCKEKGYTVKYWFLDNETWNWESPYVFTTEDFAEDVIAYGKAMKKECPDIKLIVNPTSNISYNDTKKLEWFIAQTASVIDYIDVHWYWEWGKASFDEWIQQIPLETGDKWKHPSITRPFYEDITLIKQCCQRAGAEHVGLVVLEWNIAPSDWSQTFNQSLIAIIQAELLMEFAKGGVELTCMWPFIWRTSQDVWSEQDFFGSIVTHDPPFEPTLTLDMFRLFSAFQDTTMVNFESSKKDLRVIAVEDGTGARDLMFINKNPLRRKVKVNLEREISGEIKSEMIALKNQVIMPNSVEKSQTNTLTFFAEPYSLISIHLPAPERRSAESKKQAPSLPLPTHRDVAYGSHEKQKMDVWLTHGEKPSPVVVYIHGGSWYSGDKRDILRGKRGGDMNRFLDKGISIISINYRLTNRDGITLPTPVHDSARALQFIRYMSEKWNLDKEKMAVMGGSAGGCSSLWLLLHDDLMDKASDDPVARQSTRVCAAVVQNGQSCIDPLWIKENIGIEGAKHKMICNAVGEENLEAVMEKYDQYKKLYHEFSPINHLDKDDPPYYGIYTGDPTTPARDSGHGIHHRMFGIKLKEKSDAVGHKGYLGSTQSEYETEVDFLEAILLK